MRKVLAGWFVGALLASCATAFRQAPLAPATVSPVPYALDVRFSSDVPDDYYIFSGPAQSYDRFRVNDRMRADLEEYAQRKSGPGSAEAAVIRVHLASVQTRYDQLGASLRSRRFPEMMLAHFSLLDNDLSIPTEITKEVSVTASVEVVLREKTIRRETFTAKYEEIIDRDHYDQWAYDYTGVMEGAVRRALEAVDRIVTEALAGPAKA